MRAGQKPKFVVALAVVVLLSGCVDATTTVSVDSEGEVEQLHFELVMDEEVYAMWLEDVGNDGYDSVGEAVADELAEQDGIDGGAEYEDRRENGQVAVTASFDEVNVNDLSGIATEVTEDDTVVYSDSGLGDIDEEEGEFVYRVEMPGEIVETNADEVEDGDTVAVWYPDETDTETAYVESEIDDGFSLATIAVVLGLLGVAMIAVALYQGFRE